MTEGQDAHYSNDTQYNARCDAQLDAMLDAELRNDFLLSTYATSGAKAQLNKVMGTLDNSSNEIHHSIAQLLQAGLLKGIVTRIFKRHHLGWHTINSTEKKLTEMLRCPGIFCRLGQ